MGLLFFLRAGAFSPVSHMGPLDMYALELIRTGTLYLLGLMLLIVIVEMDG